MLGAVMPGYSHSLSLSLGVCGPKWPAFPGVGQARGILRDIPHACNCNLCKMQGFA